MAVIIDFLWKTCNKKDPQIYTHFMYKNEGYFIYLNIAYILLGIKPPPSYT